MNSYLPFISAVLLSLTMACKKDDKASDQTATRKLTGKNWQLRSSSISAPGKQTIDLYALSQPCSLDDITQYTIGPNEVYYIEGPTKCNSSDPQVQTGTWVLSNSDTQLAVTLNGSTNTFVIDELTDTTLKLSYTTIQSGSTATIKTSYSSVP